MTKKELSQIFYLNKEVRMWQKELDKLQCKSLVKGQVITGMPHVPGISDQVADYAVEVAEIKMIISGKLAEIQIQRKRIMEYIDKIDDSMIRQIVFLRNISLMSWNKIADSLGGGNTEDSIRMMYGRYVSE